MKLGVKPLLLAALVLALLLGFLLISSYSADNGFPFVSEGADSFDLKVALDGNGAPLFAPLGNATARAELGRSTWRLLHTIAARYPFNPSAKHKKAISQYFDLFSQVYPCGQCAKEFRHMLQVYPPRLESRFTLSEWLCEIHNRVNVRLEKPEFDCTDVIRHYDCGCDADVT